MHLGCYFVDGIGIMLLKPLNERLLYTVDSDYKNTVTQRYLRFVHTSVKFQSILDLE
jgi:hypothetical protein